MAFGGPDYQTLYVTTTSIVTNFFTNVQSAPADPPNGDLLRVEGLGVTGRPTYRPYIN